MASARPPAPPGEATASPSLAIVKYWGKLDSDQNTPATPSVGISLAGLETRTSVSVADRGITDGGAHGGAKAGPGEHGDSVTMDDAEQDPARYRPFFTALRSRIGSDLSFVAESSNNFPAAAGLASSSSGFAALALAAASAAGAELDPSAASEVARIGSASAARAVYGGFTSLPAGALHAEQLYGADHWPELRIVVAVTAAHAKATSSRSGMERARLTSPYYDAWVNDAQQLYDAALEALDRRDIEELGTVARMSYLRMFGTMLSSSPPLLYWQPESVAIIRLCEELRQTNVPAWETMDAGPQVKILTLEEEVDRVCGEIEQRVPGVRTIVSRPGGGARVTSPGGSRAEGHAEPG